MLLWTALPAKTVTMTPAAPWPVQPHLLSSHREATKAMDNNNSNSSKTTTAFSRLPPPPRPPVQMTPPWSPRQIAAATCNSNKCPMVAYNINNNSSSINSNKLIGMAIVTNSSNSSSNNNSHYIIPPCPHRLRMNTRQCLQVVSVLASVWPHSIIPELFSRTIRTTSTALVDWSREHFLSKRVGTTC